MKTNLRFLLSLFVRMPATLAKIRARRSAPGLRQAEKSVWQALVEAFRYQAYWRNHNVVTDFFYYDLDLRSLPLKDIVAYIPSGTHYRLQSLLRYREYDCLAYDKRYEYLLFRALDLPHPQVMLLFFKGAVMDRDFRRLDPTAATAAVLNSGVRRFFLKPAFSGATRGTDVITVEDGTLRRRDGTTTTVELIAHEAAEMPSGYVLQCEMKNQHPVMRTFNPDSVNTLRIVTFRQGATFQILRILLRVGRQGQPFDNSCAGGVFIAVDPKTFTTVGECYVEKPSVRCLGKNHPDSNTPLSGVALPESQAILAMLEHATLVLSEHPYLGWDVAITTEGPCLIEVNLGFDIDHHQTAAGRGLREEFFYHPETPVKQRSKWDEVDAYWKNLETGQRP